MVTIMTLAGSRQAILEGDPRFGEPDKAPLWLETGRQILVPESALRQEGSRYRLPFAAKELTGGVFGTDMEDMGEPTQVLSQPLAESGDGSVTIPLMQETRRVTKREVVTSSVRPVGRATEREKTVDEPLLWADVQRGRGRHCGRLSQCTGPHRRLPRPCRVLRRRRPPWRNPDQGEFTGQSAGRSHEHPERVWRGGHRGAGDGRASPRRPRLTAPRPCARPCAALTWMLSRSLARLRRPARPGLWIQQEPWAMRAALSPAATFPLPRPASPLARVGVGASE